MVTSHVVGSSPVFLIFSKYSIAWGNVYFQAIKVVGSFLVTYFQLSVKIEVCNNNNVETIKII